MALKVSCASRLVDSIWMQWGPSQITSRMLAKQEETLAKNEYSRDENVEVAMVKQRKTELDISAFKSIYKQH